MNISDSTFKSLSVEMIESSSDINEWLSQFDNDKRPTAKTMLAKLVFVTRDVFSNWLINTIDQLSTDSLSALYSVRKLESSNLMFWNDDGVPVLRSEQSLGSEDFVYSLISNIVRANSDKFLEHPSLEFLREKKVRNYILIDDSIGTGDRVSDFINSMLKNPTFLSWWNYGWINITIISFSRTEASKKNIINKIKGSNHSIRKYPTSSKINLKSKYVYDEKGYDSRWGSDYREIIRLCKEQHQISIFYSLGYGKVFSNLIFSHSVPDNIPGVLWVNGDGWKPLMPERALPIWLINLLNSGSTNLTNSLYPLSPELFQLLKLISIGLRRNSSISIRLNLDSSYVNELIEHAINIGLITSEVRLTKLGRDKLIEYQSTLELPIWDNSMYIPSSWCVD